MTEAEVQRLMGLADEWQRRGADVYRPNSAESVLIAALHARSALESALREALQPADQWRIPVRLPDGRVAKMRKCDLRGSDMVAFIDGENLPPAGQPPEVAGVPADARDALQRFLDAAAGEGFVLGGVDAADLYVKLFPKEYAAALAAPAPQEQKP